MISVSLLRQPIAALACIALVAGCTEPPPPPEPEPIQEEGTFCERNPGWCLFGAAVVVATAASVLSDSGETSENSSPQHNPCDENRTVILNGERVHADPHCR